MKCPGSVRGLPRGSRGGKESAGCIGFRPFELPSDLLEHRTLTITCPPRLDNVTGLTFTCLRRSWGRLNVFAHSGHRYGLKGMWTRTWEVMWSRFWA